MMLQTAYRMMISNRIFQVVHQVKEPENLDTLCNQSIAFHIRRFSKNPNLDRRSVRMGQIPAS